MGGATRLPIPQRMTHNHVYIGNKLDQRLKKFLKKDFLNHEDERHMYGEGVSEKI